MEYELIKILSDHEKTYAMFTYDNYHDTQVYQDLLARIVDLDDIFEINQLYSDYIRWFELEKREEANEISQIFSKSINMIPYLDVSTGLVIPLFEIMYLLFVGYPMDVVIKTIAVYPKMVVPIISPERCEAVVLSLLYPSRGSDVDLNAIHIEPGVLRTESSTISADETYIDEEKTIITIESRGRKAEQPAIYMPEKKENPFIPQKESVWDMFF